MFILFDCHKEDEEEEEEEEKEAEKDGKNYNEYRKSSFPSKQQHDEGDTGFSC